MIATSRRWHRRIAAGLCLAATIATTGVAHADDISNDLDASVDATAEAITLTAGAPSTAVGLALTTRNGDGQNGCNIQGNDNEVLVVTVASSSPGVAGVASAVPFDTANPTRLRFGSCGDTPSISVTPLAPGTTTVTLSQHSNNTGGTFNLAPATFTVTVASACAAVPTTPPAVVLASPPSATGWYNALVAVPTFTVNPATNAEYTVDGGSTWLPYGGTVTVASDGIHVVAARNIRPASSGCAFAAGPASGTTTVQVDRSAPTLSVGVDPALPNAAGWNNTPVAVDWSCADVGPSGLLAGSCPDVTYGDGDTVPAVDVTVTDLAGNTSSSVHRRAVKVDTTAPTLTVAVTPTPNAAGWNNTVVAADWTCTDGTSGFAVPSPCPTDESFGEADSPVAERPLTVTDLAGNSSTATRRAIRIDETAPSITVTATPDASDGWNNGPVTVDWECSGGASSLSALTPCPADDVISAEGVHPAVTASIEDTAGNESAPATRREVRIDSTPPVVTVELRDADGAAVSPNGNGWIAHAVTVHFACSDPTSGGVASGVATGGTYGCPADVALGADGTHAGFAYEVRDAAGNATTGTTDDVRIDQTAPVLRVSVTPEPNAAGWNNSAVTVTWTCDELGSGLAGLCPVGATFGNGSDEPALEDVTVVDLAGNTSNPVDRRAIRVDTMAPTVGVVVAPELPNAAGWNNVPVTVTWTCSDLGGAGIAPGSCPADATYGDGDTVAAAELTVVDLAGNTSATVSRRGIKVDTTRPTLAVVVTPAPNSAGWNNGIVTAAWTCTDGTGSGFADTDECPTDETFDEAASPVTERTVTVTDQAGNEATATRRAVLVDVTRPSIGVAVSPDATDGWNNGPVSADWTCADSGSGLAPSTACPSDEGFTAEGTYPARSESVDDVAGNTSPTTTRRAIRIDTTAPTVTVELRDAGGALVAANADGWFAQPVVVHVVCADPTSGGVSSGVTGSGAYACPADETLAQGSHPGRALEVRDVAGNAQTATSVPPIRIDTTAPTAAVLGVTNGSSHLVGAAPTPSCTTTDGGGSGVSVPATVTVTGAPDASGAGAFTATCSGGSDSAGNPTVPASVSYTVGYAFPGIFQPINDPAGSAPSVFRQGSTVPVKFALLDARGGRLSDAAAQAIADTCSARLFTGVVATGSPGVVNEAISTSAASTGNCFRYDAAADQFIFNLNTKGMAAGTYVLEARISSGSSVVTTRSVTVGLR